MVSSQFGDAGSMRKGILVHPTIQQTQPVDYGDIRFSAT